MTEIDNQVFDGLIASHFMLLVAKTCGDSGIKILRELLVVIRKVYDQLDPEHIQGSMVIFKTFENQVNPLPRENSNALLNFNGIHQGVITHITIQVLENGQYLLWKEPPLDILLLSDEALVYEYRNRVDRLIVKKQVGDIPKLLPERSSNFAQSTFSDLRNALEDYKIKMVRYSSCKIFTQAWFDKSKIFLRNGPEYIFRDSLTQFLKSRLRDHEEVRPEQIVDDSHPVDIKVTWTRTNRIAIIEIKWLGKSKKDDGSSATQYSESRARDGASQLAEYLEMNKVQAPENPTSGSVGMELAKMSGKETTQKRQGEGYDRTKERSTPHTKRRRTTMA